MAMREAFASKVRSMGILRSTALLLVAYLLFSQTGLHPFAATGVFLVTGEGDFSKQAIVLGIAVLMLVVTWDRARVWNNVGFPLPVFILFGYCLLTVSWALAPDIALRRLALTGISVWLCFRSVSVLGYARSLHVVRWALILLLLLNYAARIFTPYGVHDVSAGDDGDIIGNWKGIMAHKNIAGSLCALTVIAFSFDRRTFSSLANAVVLGLACVFLYFTHAKTAMAGLAVALPAGWAGAWLSQRSASLRVMAMVIGGLVSVQLLSIYQGDLITALDDPHGFTGRSLIWQLLLDYARTHLWKGAGFGSFWLIGNASPIWDYDNGWVAQLVSSGHNGYLDLLVTIGLPGLLLALIMLFVLPIGRLWISPPASVGRRKLLLAIFAFVIVHNLGESELLDRMSMVNMFLMLAIAWINVDGQPIEGPRELVRQLGARMRSLAS